MADCANGSASFLAPELFARLGARVAAIHCCPDGRNINLDCGSLHLEPLRSATAAELRAPLTDVVNALLSVVDRLVVINFGRKLAEGEPKRVMADPRVREVYMGIPTA